jgi:hypothetical protein
MKAPVLTASDGLTACAFCNAGFEGAMQQVALWNGWKVRRFCRIPLCEIPVWYRVEGGWFRLNADGSRDPLTDAVADELRVLAGIITFDELDAS